MIRLIEFPVMAPDGCTIHSSMGSLLQGVLMERIPSEVAAEWHKDGLRPYSQCIYFDHRRQQAFWRLGFLTEKADTIIYPSICKTPDVHLVYGDLTIQLGIPVQRAVGSFQSLADELFQSDTAPDGCELRFLTPGSFKRQGRYVNVPELYLLFQSLIQRWNAFSDFSRLEEENLAEHLADACQMTQYDLHSQVFSLEGRRIYGYGGRMRLRFHGRDMTRRILGLLCRYAQFSGIGIKTAIGMGAVDTELFYRREGTVGKAVFPAVS